MISPSAETQPCQTRVCWKVLETAECVKWVTIHDLVYCSVPRSDRNSTVHRGSPKLNGAHCMEVLQPSHNSANCHDNGDHAPNSQHWSWDDWWPRSGSVGFSWNEDHISHKSTCIPLQTRCHHFSVTPTGFSFFRLCLDECVRSD